MEDIINRNFSQMITLQLSEPEKLIELIHEWDVEHANTDIMGYMGARVLADREHVGRYVIIVDFGVIDPNVSAAEEAARNNARPRTQAMAAAAEALADGPPEFHSYDEIYRTDR